MYLWRRQTGQAWWSVHEDELSAVAGNRLAIIEQAGRKRLQLEVTSTSHGELRSLVKRFGGRVETLPPGWLKRFARKQKMKPLDIGRRLIITNVGGTSVSQLRAEPAASRRGGPSHIV